MNRRAFLSAVAGLFSVRKLFPSAIHRDDTEWIQRAIDTCARMGGTLTLAPGVYHLSRNIHIRGRCVIVGCTFKGGGIGFDSSLLLQSD